MPRRKAPYDVMCFDFTAKGSALGELITAVLMAPRARREMSAILERWEGR